MRKPTLLGLLGPTVLAGCGSLTVATHFAPLDDLRTTTPRSLAEGGHSTPAVPPAGVLWQLSLQGLEENPSDGVPSRRYEVRLSLAVRGDGAAAGTVHPRLEQATLVDDDGRAFAASAVTVLDDGPDGPREFLAVFELPPSYRFRAVGRTTVHWALQLADGQLLRISSRFRRV